MELEDGQHPVILHTVDFQIRKEVLVDKSRVFKKLLTSKFAEAKNDIVTLEGDQVTSMEIWFRVLHAARIDNIHTVPLEEMWHLAAACDKYDLNIGDLKGWFGDWYDKSPRQLDPRKLLYPCWIFVHARELFEPNERLLKANCICKERTLFDYEKALYRIGVWPLERVAQRNSIRVILAALDLFSYVPPKQACSRYCQRDYKAIVAAAQALTQGYFDGLCLDCMDKSKPKTGDADMDYWLHNDLGETGRVEGCRFLHKQPTWYFSFMGRKEERDRFREKKQVGRHRDHDAD